MSSSRPSLHPLVAAALAPGEPGRLVKGLGAVLPGVGKTREQITDYADHWRRSAELALAGDRKAPLLIALGDSLAQGVGASNPERGYVGLVQSHLASLLGQPVSVVNLSRSGAVISDLIETQLPAVAQLPTWTGPCWNVCTIGNNDLMAGARPKTVARRFHTLVPLLPANATVATLPAAGSIGVKLLNRSIREVAAEHQHAIADVGTALKTWRGNTAGDRFHPNDRGYRIWADAFTSAIHEETTNLETGPQRN